MHMIEKVARAILFEDCGSSEGWENNLNLAIAAIKAMRDYDRAMADEAYVKDYEFPTDAYTAMINAALGEHK